MRTVQICMTYSYFPFLSTQGTTQFPPAPKIKSPPTSIFQLLKLSQDYKWWANFFPVNDRHHFIWVWDHVKDHLETYGWNCYFCYRTPNIAILWRCKQILCKATMLNEGRLWAAVIHSEVVCDHHTCPSSSGSPAWPGPSLQSKLMLWLALSKTIPFHPRNRFQIGCGWEAFPPAFSAVLSKSTFWGQRF